MLDDSAYLSRPVQRAARRLCGIAKGDPMTDVARTNRNLGINRTALLRLLHTLEAKRFIAPRRPEGAGWQIGTGLIGLAARAFAAEDLTQVAIPMRARRPARRCRIHSPPGCGIAGTRCCLPAS